MFTIGETLKYGWNKAKEKMELVFFTTLLVLAVSFFLNSLNNYNRPTFSVFSLLIMVFLIILRIGYKKIFLRIYDGDNPAFSDIFKEFRLFWKYIGVSILYVLIVLGGLILLLIPGIFWAVRFSFSFLVVVDARSGPISALKESYAITKGRFWKLLGFWIVIGLFNLLGFLVFGIGLLVTLPVSTLATIYAYRTLSKNRASLMEKPSPQVPA